jgi:serine/threonine protein kinase/tetratricopeptide (TPR) repeat protein
MNPSDSELAPREERLGQLFSDWLEEVEQGRRPDRKAWLARYPEFAAELEEFLAAEDRLQALAAPLREATRAALAATTPWGSPTAGGSGLDLPAVFGDYELLEEIGRGGMGVVYRARQQGLGRCVALKLFRADPLGGAADLQRFRNEAELVAQLDHPHVVPIYEVGEHEGRVYFSMKLIEGGSLDARLDRFISDPRAAASLLVAVARAVHHAHQRGILHRDLKPANVLLESPHPPDPPLPQRGEGGELSFSPSPLCGRGGWGVRGLVPYVTDFGLARRIEADAGLTHSGAVLGTPAYMAPEQAAARRGAVTTAADVYGLGTILYALLTGRPPFQGDSVLQTLEQVKGRDPEPPRRRNRRVPRDLETICLKCLRKEPERRYESAAALADDLERFLHGEPIHARPLGRVGRLWRWCRRQPVQASLAAALLLAVATGLALVTWQWQRAEEHYRTAEDLRRAAVGHEAEVEDSFNLAHEVVKDFTMRLGDPGLFEAHHGLEPLQREMLQKAQAYFRKFLQRRGHDPALRRESAETSAALAQTIRLTGSPDEALDAYRRAIALYETLVRDEPDNLGFRLELAKLYNHATGVLDALGRLDESRDSIEHARELLEEARRRWPADAGLEHELACTIHNLGMVHQSGKRLDPALACFTEARALHEKLLRAHPDHQDYQDKLANTLNNLGLLLRRKGRPAEGLEALRESAAMRDRLAQRFPNNLVLQAALAQSLCNVGECLRESGRPAEAIESLRRAHAILVDLTRASPHVTGYRLQLGVCHAAWGLARVANDDPQQALEAFAEAGKIFEQLAREYPRVPEYQRRLAQVWLEMAGIYFNRNEDEAAVQAYEQARDIAARLAETYPDELDHVSRLGRALNDLALPLRRLGRLEDARSALLRAVEQHRRALDRVPREPVYRRLLSGSYTFLTQVECERGQAGEALAVMQKRLELWPDDAGELYAAARDSAGAVPGIKSQPASRRCADLALEALRQAVQVGFRNAEQARTDPALEPLRSRPEFQELLTQMSTGPAAPPRR